MSLAALSGLIHAPKILATTCFETQRNGEKIILLLRRHPVTNAKWILRSIAIALLPVLFINLDVVSLGYLTNDSILPLFKAYEWTLFFTVYYVILIYYVFLNVLEWFFTVMLVTPNRILDINFTPPYQRQSTQAQLEEVQDVEETQQGMFSTIFNFGDIFIQTAGTKQNIYLRKVPQPNLVHNKIIQLLYGDSPEKAFKGKNS